MYTEYAENNRVKSFGLTSDIGSAEEKVNMTAINLVWQVKRRQCEHTILTGYKGMELSSAGQTYTRTLGLV